MQRGVWPASHRRHGSAPLRRHYHDVDSSAQAFEIAASLCFRTEPSARLAPPRADHEERSRRPGAVHGRRHRRHQLAPREILGMSQPATARSSTRKFRSPRCSATSPTALDDARPGDVVTALLALRPRPQRGPRGSGREGEGTSRYAFSRLASREPLLLRRGSWPKRNSTEQAHVKRRNHRHIDHGKTTLTAALVKSSRRRVWRRSFRTRHREGGTCATRRRP